VRADIESVADLRFNDGGPVRAASALAPLGDGWLVAQDDATHGAWRRETADGRSVVPVRVLPPVEGLDVFSEAAGTKHLKPDFEAACEVTVAGAPAVLLLGSGSTAARMRASVVRLGAAGPEFTVVDLAPLYARVAEVLGTPLADLNLEGACRLGRTVRWFNRGNLTAGVPSASVDVDLTSLVAAAVEGADPAEVRVGSPRRYDLGDVDGVGLAVTDAVALPDGRVLLSAAAEDTPNAVDDGPVVGAALALVDGDDVLALAPLAAPDGTVHKVEGLGLRGTTGSGVRLLAVVDADDPAVPSAELSVRVDW
jgi:hypothetical protein